MLVKQIVIWICEACLEGEGQECHTPGCALFLHKVDLAIHKELYIEIGVMEEYKGPKGAPDETEAG